ncbi:MAG TPA: acyltransferase family protein [Opitutales bacterium]|nr:acyltransferase family protein [Opitutales bacterium]
MHSGPPPPNVNETGNRRARPTRHPYFPHIDGLRALAIIPVVIYHLSPAWCPGGFSGVDVFFVISGYLITGGIIVELNQGGFSFVNFYVRRIKRILPAYLALLAGVLLISLLAYSVDEYKSICITSFYSIIFCANIYFERIIGYFDLAARSNPLLNLWSLGVEEQFYLTVPLVVWLLWIWRKKFLRQSLAGLLLASFLLGEVALRSGHANFAFFMLPCRAWELLAGAILSQWRPVGAGRFAGLYRGAGFILIVIPYIFYTEQTLFPGFAALPSVLGTMLLIRYGNEGWGGKLLTCPPAVGVGRVSYSLYLWHWPIFVILGSDSSAMRAAIGLAGAGVASYLSWRLVERPVRQNKAFGPRQTFTMMVACNAMLAVVCWLGLQFQSKNGGLPETFNGVTTWMGATRAQKYTCDLKDLEAGEKSLLIPIGKAEAQPTFVLWGDSHALALLPGMDLTAREQDQAGLFIDVKNVVCDPTEEARRDREPVLRWLEERPDIHRVFLANYWLKFIGTEAGVDETIEVVARLHDAGKQVYIFQTAPTPNLRAVQFLSWGFRAPQSSLRTAAKFYEAETTLQRELAEKLTQRHLATILPLNAAFLDNGSYMTATASLSYYADANHLNRAGSIKAMEFLAPMIWDHP